MHDHGPTPPAAPRHTTYRNVRIFVVLLVGAALTTNLALPGKAAAPVLGIGAVVFGIISLVQLVRYRLSTLLRVSVVLGLALSALLTVGTAAMVVVWPVTADYETCISQALTQQATSACTRQYEQTLLDWQQSLSPY